MTPGNAGGPVVHTSNAHLYYELVAGVVNAPLSTKDVSNISGSIFPNPVSSTLIISNSIETKTYKVVNLLGKTVKDVEATGSLDVSDLSAGIYILKTDAGIAKFVKK